MITRCLVALGFPFRGQGLRNPRLASGVEFTDPIKIGAGKFENVRLGMPLSVDTDD